MGIAHCVASDKIRPMDVRRIMSLGESESCAEYKLRPGVGSKKDVAAASGCRKYFDPEGARLTRIEIPVLGTASRHTSFLWMYSLHCSANDREVDYVVFNRVISRVGEPRRTRVFE